MRHSLPLILCVLISFGSYANTVTTTIDAVTVYRQTARVSQSGTATLPAGSSEIIINNLSAGIILPSVQVSLEGSATILSVTSRVNTDRPKPNLDKIAPLNDTIKDLNEDLDWINQQMAVYVAEEGVLNEKQKMVGTEVGLTVAEYDKLLVSYRTRGLDIKQKLFKLKQDAQKINERKAALQTKINEINNQTVNPTGEIVVMVLASAAGKVEVKCNYMVRNAGWTPIYDLRSDGIDKPVSLNYYAQVYQSTGYDWKNVKMTVSTGNPSQNNSRPVLVPLYIDFFTQFMPQSYQEDGKHFNMINSGNMAYYKPDDENAKNEQAYPVTVSETGLNAVYIIELAQTIPSDGKTRQVPLKEYQLPATYVYHTVPRLDNGAFLLAKITDWGQYNLLAGEANIFFNDWYVGQSHINPQITADTLLLSMGRDEQINIQRQRITDKESHRLFETKKTEKRTYEISVRNNKSKAISIEILDQVPVSKQEKIVVEVLDEEALLKSGAEYNKEIGKLLWRLELAPGETKKVRFSFQVTYEKDKTVTPF